MHQLGILSYSIANDLEPHVFQWCIQAWQTYQAGTTFDATISRHKLWPTLEFCLRHNGLWEYLPEELQEQLRNSRQQYALRQLQLISQLDQLDTALAAKGLQGILLKGSALLFHPIYPSLGDRGTADIDIAVALDQIPAFVSVLASLYYETEDLILPEITDRTHHLPPFCRSDSLNIEIHPLATFDGAIQQFSEEIETTATYPDGFTALKVPTPTELFWHMAWHTWFNYPQLRNILDLYRLQSLYEIDLPLLTQRAQTSHLARRWEFLIQQMQALASGKLTVKNIIFWEWLPKFRAGYLFLLPERSTCQSWQALLSRHSRFKHPFLACLLYPGILAARLCFVAVTYLEWLLNFRRFLQTSAILLNK